ncbi:MAG: primosomal protein N' [Bacteroidales bacterium]|nr:primosomal protein N' [Bacteroidales bacterium]MCF8326968.1 primosomal protein N' [Bacteroidales bacterium]
MDEKKPLFAEVLLPLPVKGTFTYRVPVDFREEAEVGKRAVVPFGRNKIYSGIIYRLHQNEPQKYKAKDVRNILDEKPVITSEQTRLWEWISEYYMAFMGETMNAALPSAMKLASESKVKLHPAYDGVVSDLSMPEHKILENLGDNVALSIKEISKITGYRNVMPVIKNLIEKECVIMQEELQNTFKPKKEPFLRLAREYVDSEQELQNLLDNFSNKAYRQMEVLMMFLSKTGNDRSALVARKRIIAGDSKYNAAIRALVGKGILIEEKKTISRIDNFKAAEEVGNITLTVDQVKALTQIHEGFANDKVSLLHGVTSSGKTEIYIHLIEEQLQKNKQVLYLLPEIALTAQIINRLTYYFGNEVVVYHSRFNEQERTETWNLVLNKQRRVIVGARSALFLPFRDLGLVIVDEEHDNSFKQYEPAPRYQGRDVAVYLGRMFHASVILGSATPSVESYANAEAGKYHLAELHKRYGDIQMPEIQVADLVKASKQKQMYSHYSYMLLKNIKETLDKGLQVILFQNRRGFSLRLQCQQCGWMPECPNCDVGMIYHKYQNNLRCHYCGHKAKVPEECPECGSTAVKMQGFGTEKIEEELPNHFPDVKIARMDLDSTRSKNAYYRLISDFEARKLDILVGTQMVTKGLDFDHVGLVGVMNMDNLLGFPDFRAFEKAFQLLAQVSGRAGRKGEQGKVIVQTRQPYHSVIRYAMNNDYHAMFKSQLQERKIFKYPPYYRLVRITLKHKDQDTVYKASQVLAGALRARLGKRILGPEFPAIARIRRLYLRNILVKIANNDDKKNIKKFILDEIRTLSKENDYKSVKVAVDVDPV